MAIDAFIHLDELRCLAESDGSGHSEPYAWTVMLWVDDTTIGSGEIVGSRAPGNVRGARTVIKDGMRAGETAPMPSFQRSFARRFEDGLQIRNVGVVVLLLEADETPQKAARAAYDAFRTELPKAVADFIRTNQRAPQNEQERQQIANQVRPKVRAAGEDALSRFERLRVFLGTLNLDDEIDFAFFFTELPENQSAPEEFTLTMRTADGDNDYEIAGRFELRPPPAPDRCQPEIDALQQARARVDGLEAEIRSLQEELRNAAPSMKPAILRMIRAVREEEMPQADAAVEAAEQALAQCRARSGVLPGGVLGAERVRG